MSGRVTGMVFDRYPGAGGGELLLAVKLADNAHDDGTHIFPSVATLARATRQSERTVQYQLRRMQDMGWLILVREEQRGRPGFDNASRRGREYRISPQWMDGGECRPAAPPAPSAPALPLVAAPVSDDEASAGPTLPVREEKGANSAPFYAGDKLCVSDGKGCNLEQKRVQPGAEKGATAIAPEPSVNHQYSNRQREARGRAPEPSPDSSPAAHHGAAVAPDAMAEFPISWKPDAACEAVLRARGKPMPAQFVVDGFAAHWAGRWIAPRRIPNEFLKWVCREAGMRGGRVPVDGDGAQSSAEAGRAWDEVRSAGQRGALPTGGWSHPGTRDALQAIGGFSRVENMLTKDVPFVRREFLKAFSEGRRAA